MRILLIGTVSFSELALNQLINMGTNIVGVCTSKEKGINADHVNLRTLANKHDIPCLEISDTNDPNSLSWIKKLKPSVIFCFGWSKIIGKDLLKVPKIGVIGFHPAALPFNRGRHPIIWALVLGLTETASTFFFMDKDFDSGDILSESIIKIHQSDDANILYNKICEVALKQIEEFVPKLTIGNYLKTKQINGL